MSFVIYNKKTSAIHKIVRHRPYKVTESFKSIAAAKAAITRLSNKYWKDSHAENSYSMDQDPQFTLAIAESEYYFANIEKMVEKTNLMTGKKFMESINTPYYLSPSSETYWSA